MSPEASAPYTDSFLQRSPLLRRAAFTAIGLCGLPWMIRHTLQRDRATLVLYHEIGPDLFREQVSALRKRYNLIPLSQLIDHLEGGASIPPRALVITLDDGWASNRLLFPVIVSERVPVAIFLCSGIVGTGRGYWWSALPTKEGIHQLQLVPNRERVRRLREEHGFDPLADREGRAALSDQEVEEMKEAVEFESHTRLHPILITCDDQEAREEIAGSKQDLKERYGIEAMALSYPDGYYGEREVRMLREEGYRCALTLDPGYVDGRSDPFRLKRYCLSDDGGISELIVKTSGLWAFVRLLINLLRG
jgi:peptidoglycan/xylan/chitin deacetylase (PgdA/CDA1 family)